MIEAGSKPDRRVCDVEVKPYLREWEKLSLVDGVLYRRRTDPDSTDTVYQLVLPVSERDVVLRGLHDEVGHLGVERTLQLVRARYFWPKMADDVQNKVQTCPTCVRRKPGQPQRAPLVNITTTQPMELVCIDFLSLEPSAGGVENILVLTDHYTRLAYAIPCKNQTARTTAQALLSFFLHYGFPLKLLSDQGRNFESETIKELCKLANITKLRTTPYHPMGNGMCERLNQTLLGMLGCLSDDQKKNWKKYVPSLVHAYNCTKHESTGYAPFYLMFGRQPRLAIDVAMGFVQKEPELDFTRDLKNRLDVAYKLATKQAEKSKARYKKHYDQRARGSTVQVGDRVLVRNVRIRGKQKLANTWETPVFIVLDQPDDQIPVFVVKQEDGKGAKRTLHRNLLMPVNFLPLPPEATLKKPQSSKKKPPPVEATDHFTDVSDSQSDSDDQEDRYLLRSRLNPSAREFVPAVPLVADQGDGVGVNQTEVGNENLVGMAPVDVSSESDESVDEPERAVEAIVGEPREDRDDDPTEEVANVDAVEDAVQEDVEEVEDEASTGTGDGEEVDEESAEDRDRDDVEERGLRRSKRRTKKPEFYGDVVSYSIRELVFGKCLENMEIAQRMATEDSDAANRNTAIKLLDSWMDIVEKISMMKC